MIRQDYIMKQIEELGKVLANLLEKRVNNNPSLKIDILTEYDKNLDIFHELNKLSKNELLDRIQLNEYELSLVEYYCFIIIEKFINLKELNKANDISEINKISTVLSEIELQSSTFSQKRIQYLEKLKSFNQNQD